MFKHQDAVCGGNGNGAARATLANDDRDNRDIESEAAIGRARDGFGLATFFRANAGICARRVNQGDHRQVEFLGHFHKPHGLAIAFRHGHAKVVLDAALGVGALFMADDHDGAAAEFTHATDNGFVVAKIAITR